MTPDTPELCTKCNTMKHCTDGVCGRCAVPEPVQRMVERASIRLSTTGLFEGKGDAVLQPFANWLSTEATNVYNDAVREERKRLLRLIDEHDPSTNRQTSSAYWGNTLRKALTPPTDNSTNV